VIPPHQPGQAGEREENRQHVLGALRERLHDDARALRTPGDWGACLRLAARLPGEDFANILLIRSQRPGATLVRDCRQWTAAGRQVRTGETGIAIFATPARPGLQRQDQDEPGPAWREAERVTYVRDLTQTTGPPPGGTGSPPRDPLAGVQDALCWLARREGYAVEREHGPPPDGTVFWAARRIRIPPGLSGEQAVWALAHQLGHVLLHHDPGYSPGATTSGCAGLRKAEADSVAWITCTRHSITPAGILPHPASWAGTDPRSQPAAAILATGHRITAAATLITRHTSRLLHGDLAPVLRARPRPAAQAARPVTGQQGTPSRAPQADGAIRRILADAHAFYTGQIAGSWAPGYLHARGITAAAIADWRIGCAPAGWNALTSHLRRLGHGDDAIQAAGLATRSSRGTLIDRFRDRIMLPVHDAAGELAGFTRRARPDAGPGTPKYLNSPQAATYNKSHLLSGWHQARPDPARGSHPPHRGRRLRRHRRQHRRPRPSRRAGTLRHRTDLRASRPAQPGRRPVPHRDPRRVRLRHRRPQSRHPRPRHPPPAHQQPPVGRARRQGPR
jgi:DNA primase-like protein